MARAAGQLAWTFGYRLKQPEKAEHWGRHAIALLERNDYLGVTGAGIYANLAVMYASMGNYTEAEKLARKALASRLEALGPDHPLTQCRSRGLFW